MTRLLVVLVACLTLTTAAHAEHRVACHPELARKPRRRRNRTFLEQALKARERRLGKRQEAA